MKMNLFEEVQKARKMLRGDEASVTQYNILTLLVGELETVSKRNGSASTDEIVVAAIKKLIKSNEESIKLAGPSPKLHDENIALRSFLPEEMSAEQIKSVFVEEGIFGNIGQFMKHMSDNYIGKFDRGLASKVAKELL